MFIKIQFEKETPIYEQLRHQIIKGIATGELREGESMPSVRQLAADLGINLHTVNKTYNLLKNEGFLIVHPRKKVIVNSYKKMQENKSVSDAKEKLYPILAEIFCRGVDRDEMANLINDIYKNFEMNKEDK